MGFIIVVIILYFIFRPKEQNSDTSRDSRILVDCPYCDSELFIKGEGSWNCLYCEETFIYKSFDTYRMDEVCNDAILELVTLAAKVARADGSVSQKEISILDNFLSQELGLNSKQRKEAAQRFNMEKESYVDFGSSISNLTEIFDSEKHILIEIIQVMYLIAEQDGGIHYEQERIISRAKQVFDIPENNYDYEETSYEDENKYTTNNVDKYYEVLNCTQNSSVDEIKRNYKKLISTYHPDKYMSKDLPEEMMNLAKEKTQEIQNAYEEIRLVRNFI